jgi:multidrug resistance efflux pump
MIKMVRSIMMAQIPLIALCSSSMVSAEAVGDLATSSVTQRPIDPVIDLSPLDESRAIPVQDCVVRFSEELSVPSAESGLIAELSVGPGDAIQWGDPIARLEDRAIRIRNRAASLRLQSAMQQTADDLEIQYAETALAEAEAELEANRSIYNDAAGAVPMSTIRRLRLSVERANLEVARAKKAADLAKIEVDLRAADVSVIEDTLRRLQIQSPLAGVVIEVYKQRGEWVTTGEPVARVARLDRLDVHALLSADQLSPQTCRDQSVSVRWLDPVTKTEHRLRGRVTSVQPQRLAGSRYRIQTSVANERTSDGKDWVLHPGTEVRMFVYPASVKK